MKILKIAVLPIILFALLAMSGCAVVTMPETTINSFQKVYSFEYKKIALLPPVVVERNMDVKKVPDATEQEVAKEVYNSLKEHLIQRGFLSSHGEVIEPVLDLELRVNYANRYGADIEYFGFNRIMWGVASTDAKGGRNVGWQILLVRASLKNKNGVAVYLDTIDNTRGTYLSNPQDKEKLIQDVSVELANQIEKILKEGVSVGKSP